MFEIYISDRAQKQLNELPKTIQIRVGSVIERLKIRPYAIVEKITSDREKRLKAVRDAVAKSREVECAQNDGKLVFSDMMGNFSVSDDSLGGSSVRFSSTGPGK